MCGVAGMPAQHAGEVRHALHADHADHILTRRHQVLPGRVGLDGLHTSAPRSLAGIARSRSMRRATGRRVHSLPEMLSR
jgi:hypothetical protein